ncbi:MarR family transcriptional regulator [Devosia sp. MC532]|uniref:MarR family transcriptional regulator n=1 Tax=Devosia sp. MC532 TaxID=2799788 RepID=UPI0018F79E14|nr:MarR family transcriptional regulator [Devosia sp. MC532]
MNDPLDEQGAAERRATTMYRIHEVARVMSTEFDKLVAEHGITRAQWAAFMHISLNPGCRQTELADKMQMGRAGAGKLLDKLEEKGWIRRETDQDDRRARRVWLKKDTPELLTIIPEASDRFLDRVYKDLSEYDVERLAFALDTVIRNLGRDNDQS